MDTLDEIPLVGSISISSPPGASQPRVEMSSKISPRDLPCPRDTLIVPRDSSKRPPWETAQKTLEPIALDHTKDFPALPVSCSTV